MAKYVPPHLRKQGSSEASSPPPSSAEVGARAGGWERRDSSSSRSWNSKENRRGGSFGGGWNPSREDTGGWRSGSSNRSAETQPPAPPPSDVDVAKSIQEREEAEKARHPDMESVETVSLQAFYTEHSAMFREWMQVRSEGYTNKYIAHFFEKKNEVKESNSHRPGAHKGAEIKPIFTQFFKYAIDIDNGVAYSERAKDIAISQGSCWFLDFGFAPGGMADLLLNAHPGIKGVGVTLDPSEGGNVYLDSLNSNDRFYPYIGDVIEMARSDLDLKKACNLPDDFDGFDFVIIGITIHQSWDGENMNELKDLLHFAQLFFALKYLKPGGMVMMRMHMSVRLVDCHFLSLMLSLFDLNKFTGLEVGRRRLEEAAQEKKKEQSSSSSSSSSREAKPRSKLDMLCQQLDRQHVQERKVEKPYAWGNLGRTAVATKPFSTFSMRKTYWVLYHGFTATEETKIDLMKRLQVVLGEGVFAYGFDAEKKCFNRPILMDMPIQELLEKYGKPMISVLEDVWEKQVIALKGFMVGLTDKMCRDGPSCRRRRCNMAHRPSEMIPEVLDAFHAVDVRARPRLAELAATEF